MLNSDKLAEIEDAHQEEEIKAPGLLSHKIFNFLNNLRLARLCFVFYCYYCDKVVGN